MKSMTSLDIARRRLYSQHLAQQTLEKPHDLVKWLGAVQSQDYPAAKWAVGQRLIGATDEALDEAFARGEILRTHVMRPTWHFVSPDDIRWMSALTVPSINLSILPLRIRELELDDAIFKRSNDVITKTLQGGKQLTRLELVSVLQQAGFAAGTGDVVRRLNYLLIGAESRERSAAAAGAASNSLMPCSTNGRRTRRRSNEMKLWPSLRCATLRRTVLLPCKITFGGRG